MTMTSIDTTSIYNDILRPFSVYSHGIDMKNYELLRDAFVPDGLWVMHDMTEIRGHEAIIEKLEAVAKIPGRPQQGLHTFHNLNMRIVGKTVESTANWIFTSRQEKGGPWSVESVGQYEDTLEKVGGKWFFTRRRIINWNL
ncbi:MAG: hypothetical protein JWO10_1416 [Microbacteriaceae bacterium]|nr:hypothetical protein [Microbacteriaceae bacterium]